MTAPARWVALIAALLTGAGSAGAAERQVNFYNWSNYMAPGVLDEFTKETGIKVTYDTFDANETLETRLLAGKSGYDLVVPSGYFLERQIGFQDARPAAGLEVDRAGHARHA